MHMVMVAVVMPMRVPMAMPLRMAVLVCMRVCCVVVIVVIMVIMAVPVLMLFVMIMVMIMTMVRGVRVCAAASCLLNHLNEKQRNARVHCPIWCEATEHDLGFRVRRLNPDIYPSNQNKRANPT